MRAECLLTIYEVNDVSVTVLDNLEYYSVFSIEYVSDRNKIIFQTEGAIEVEINVQTLHFDLTDTGNTTWDQFGYNLLNFRCC